MTKTNKIAWAPFSQKHIEYIKNAMHVAMSVAEGAIRSGKTIDNCIIAAMKLETTRDRFHLATGSTLGNAKLNIGVCNGYGLEALFRGRCRWGKYKDNEALFLQTQTGEKIVIFAGGRKADSYKAILGNSYGIWIATEINEHYDCEDSRSSFIKVAMGRQIAAKDPCTLWDLNPCAPKHRIYETYIDKYSDFPPNSGYQHKVFTIRDNMSISAERCADIESKYTVGSVWHKRDILGMRCAAEGLCCQEFADHADTYLVESPDYDYIRIGIDFGGNNSFHAFVATGLKNDNSKVTALCSDRPSAKGTSPKDLYHMFDVFLQKVYTLYGRVDSVFADSAEQVLIQGMRNSHPELNIRNSIKRVIMDRVRKENEMVAVKKLYYTKHATTVRDALCDAQFDPKELEDVRLDDGTTDIDTLDAFEYSWEKDIRSL